MRKSILLTVILALWGAMSTTNVQGQCTGSANKPILGVDYTYVVYIGEGQSDFEGDGKYQWYVTQNTADLLSKDAAVPANTGATTGGVLAATNDYFSVSTSGTEYDSPSGANGLILNWKEEALAATKSFYLVLNYTEDAVSGCEDVNNVKVLKIEPLNTFQLEMTAQKLEAGAFSDGDAECAKPVSSASIDGTGNVVYEYGEQTFYYKINAKGFVGKWKPQIRIPDLPGREGQSIDGVTISATHGQVYKSVQWSTASDGTGWTDFAGTLNADGTTQTLTTVAGNAGLASITDKDSGTPIYIKVVVENHRYEGLTDQNFMFAADGTIGTTDKSDIHGNAPIAGGDACDEVAPFAREDEYTLKARPKIEETPDPVTSGAFVVEIH